MNAIRIDVAQVESSNYFGDGQDAESVMAQWIDKMAALAERDSMEVSFDRHGLIGAVATVEIDGLEYGDDGMDTEEYAWLDRASTEASQ